MTRRVDIRLCVVVLAACAVIWTGGCGGSEPAPASKPATSAKPAAKAAPAAAKPAAPPTAAAKPSLPAPAVPAPAVEPAPPPAPQEQAYVYRAGNRRDPFRSIIVSRERQAEAGLLHPLQQYAVKDLKLVAVVWGQLGAGAMLETPDGKGYTVYVGTNVGNRDGVVKQIKPDQVVVRERYTDIFGEKKEESVVLNLHLPEEGLK